LNISKGGHLWFNPTWQLSTRQPLAHSAHLMEWQRKSEE